jgi:hypothetical protein
VSGAVEFEFWPNVLTDLEHADHLSPHCDLSGGICIADDVRLMLCAAAILVNTDAIDDLDLSGGLDTSTGR